MYFLEIGTASKYVFALTRWEKMRADNPTLNSQTVLEIKESFCILLIFFNFPMNSVQMNALLPLKC